MYRSRDLQTDFAEMIDSVADKPRFDSSAKKQHPILV